MKIIERLIKPVYAHCDIPCGIYETDTMTHAAQTCVRMVELLEQLGEPTTTEKKATLNRCVWVKEKHANKCKRELYTLWSDYFKPEHLDKYPDLHEKFWMAAKQCGKVKQTVSKEECQKLCDMVADIATMFADSKKK
ncbi:MAG TPA: superoxide dismutase, Ni [Candidatus Saccharimonadales bacterium]|nr:superoxide dismutase, Ni [Candidatus Saccharimonadales bacterium]